MLYTNAVRRRAQHQLRHGGRTLPTPWSSAPQTWSRWSAETSTSITLPEVWKRTCAEGQGRPGSGFLRFCVSAIWLNECKRGASSFSVNGCRCDGETLSTLFWRLLAFDFSDTFTDTAISSSRINGEHKEKVLQRWDGGDSNGESYDLETDTVSFIHSVKFLCIQTVTYC